MISNIFRTIEFGAYHLLIGRISRIQPVGEAYKRHELLLRYLGDMMEIRVLKAELVRVKGKNYRSTLRLRCSQALAFFVTRGDKIYHDETNGTINR